MLASAKRVGMWKRIAFVGNLCLRGKVGRVGRRTLMKLRVVSPIVVPTHGGLRVAPRLGLIFAQLRALTATWRLLWGRRRSNGERMGFSW
jgi:hypothetical protein